MATTIDRTGLILTDDTGSYASPAGDGTPIDNALFDTLLDAIDKLFNGVTANPLVLGSRLQVDGFGTHPWSAGGTGNNLLYVRNSTAGVTNTAELAVGNDGSVQVGRFVATASSYTPSAPFRANSAALLGTLDGGLVVGTTHASGTLGLVTNAVERARFHADGRMSFGTASAGTDTLFRVGGSITAASALGVGMTVDPTITGAAGQSIVGLQLLPTFVEAATGTHSNLFGLYIPTPTITAGAATITNVANLFVGAPPAGSGATTAWAIQVGGGQTGLPDGTAAAPALSFTGDPDTGIFRSVANAVSIAVGGLEAVLASRASGTYSVLQVIGTANGTGAVRGNVLEVGRNTSGSGAAGVVGLTMRGGSARVLWVDNSGNLLIHTAAPTEDNTTVSDTAGTVVGTQTSRRETKTDIRPFEDYAGALAFIQGVPLRRFRYRDGSHYDCDFLGIIADEAPELVMHPEQPGGLGRAFNPVNAFGYTAAAIKALLARVKALEARA